MPRASPPSPGLTAALAARDAGQKPPSVRVSLAEVLQWVNWKAASGADATRHLARPRGQEVGVPDPALPRRPCRRRLHRHAMARDARADRRPSSRRSEVQHARRATPAHRRALRDHHAVVRRQDARRDPEDGAGQGRAVRPDLLARRAARDGAVRGARLPHRPRASRGSARSACRSFPCSGTAGPSRRSRRQLSSSPSSRSGGGGASYADGGVMSPVVP